MRKQLIVMTMVALAGCLMPLAAAAGGDPMPPGDPAKGAKVFRKCLPCHRIGPGAHTVVGPELNGVVGRVAGSVPDYSYSPAMKNSGLTWDEETLAKYLRAPRTFLPGVRMTFAGVKRDKDLANLIAYLKQFDANGDKVAAAPAQ